MNIQATSREEKNFFAATPASGGNFPKIFFDEFRADDRAEIFLRRPAQARETFFLMMFKLMTDAKIFRRDFFCNEKTAFAPLLKILRRRSHKKPASGTASLFLRKRTDAVEKIFNAETDANFLLKVAEQFKAG